MKVHFNSLKTRLIVVLVCMALVPAIAASWIARNMMFETLRADRITDVGLVADAKRDQLVMMLHRQNARGLAFLANLSIQCDDQLGKPTDICVTNLMKSYISAENALGMSLNNVTGRILNVGNPAIRHREDSLFPAGQLAKFSGTGSYRNRSYFISVADEKTGYRLSVTYSSTVLESIFFPYPAALGSSGESFLADGTGYFVTQNKYASTQGHSHPISARPMQACLGGLSRDVLDRDYRDADIIHGFRFIPEFGSACIMAHITQEEAFAPLGSLEKRLIAALSLFALLLTVVAIYLAKMIVRPVSELTAVVRGVTAGNYKVKADEAGMDELAELATSFNNLTKKLRESSRLMEGIIEHIPAMVFVKRASDLHIEIINRVGSELTGYPQETLIGKSDYDLWPKEQGDFFTAADRKVLASHEVMEIPEEPITRANGEIRMLQTWKVALRDEGGEPTHLLGISIDITERKKTERSLQAKEQRLEEAQRIAKLGSWELDLLSNQLIWSDEIFRMFELDKAQFSATYESFLNIIHPDDREAVNAAYTRSLETKEGYAIDHRLLFPDGRIKYVHEQCQTVFSETGQPLCSLGTVQDITEHKHAELEILKLNAELEYRVFERTTELSDAATRIQTILSTVADGIITIDECGMIETVNRAAERIFGYATAEIIGQNIKMLMPEPYRSQHDSHLDHYRVTGESRIIGAGREAVGRRKDGSIFPLELAVNEMWLGDQRHFTGVLRDITARKQADEVLQNAKNSAESASRIKSNFLAAMSHEIRTPMNGVIGMLDVLTQTSLNGYQAEMAELIRESANTLLGIIEDILDFSKIEAGKFDLEQECLSIEDVVEKACSMFDYMAEHRRTELTLFVDPEIPNVLGDALRLHQILTNLINNALKFSSAQNRLGQVMVRVLITRREDGRIWLEFTVRDNGIGMDEATQYRLFAPFEQADSSTKRLFGGTGLGLAISNQLVHMMGGEINVQSELGAGSTFTVHLPFTAVPQSETMQSLVDGLPCLLIGHDTGLTADIAVHLTYAGAQVQRVTDIDAARHADAPTDPIWIWILDTLGAPSLLNELRAISCMHKQHDIRFLVVGRGKRRRPRLENDDLVGVDGNLLTRRITLQAVAIAAGRAKEHVWLNRAGLPREAFDAPSHNEGVHQGKLILVAEDNEINQQVIRRQLALLGFASEVADDGYGALNLWKTGEYALLLTDVNMPEMDGYELTAAIRAEEKTGTSHMPIIALTANALKDEKEICKEAGMDDYLSKPVRLDNLKAMLEKWMPLTSQSLIAPQAELAAERPVDVRVLQDLIGNDAAVINELLQDFSAISVSIATKLNAYYAAGRLVEVGAVAHKLKSSARSIGALKLGELCEQIEHTCNAEESAALAELMSHFNEEMTAVENYLATWTNDAIEPENNKGNA